METYFEKQAKDLYERATEIINQSNEEIDIPKDFKEEFFKLIDKVNLSLMEDKENFYGYFLFQMKKEVKFDISSPTAVNFKNAKYVIYFNPLVFLNLSMKQMETTIKHEILHILSFHIIRGKELKEKYSTLATNIAMDIVVNQYLDYLPPYAVTLEWINSKYQIELQPYDTFENYVSKIQTELDLQEVDEDGEENDSWEDENIEDEFKIQKTHDIWNDSNDIDAEILEEFTKKFVDESNKGQIPAYLNNLISQLKNSKAELPWNLYLKKLMGTIESNKKKTITRRNRRQPDRLDLRGNLRSHKAEIAVAIDTSGSISDEEFKQAIKEVLSIVKNYNHEITIIECDNEIRQVYKVKSIKDIKDRTNTRGGTKFEPVFEYANKKNINLLIYFTDGEGEEKLKIIPKGYKVLWVISSRGDKLSLKNPHGVVKKLGKIEIKEDVIDINDIRLDGYSMNNQAPIL